MEQAIADNVAAEVSSPRLTIILHPNPSRVDIALSDRFFNKERYSFSRKQEAVGAEKELLVYCETYIVGIDGAKASKNTLSLELSDGVLLREFIPQVVTAIKRWGSETEPYKPEIYVENRRWAQEPVYDADDMCARVPGIRQQPNEADIGLPYKLWQAGK